MTPEPTDRFPDEVERLELAQEVEYLLNPLAARCDALEAAPALSADDALLLDQLTEFIAAVGRYDAATERLLTAYREALGRAERPTAEPVPTLEQAILSQLTPAQLLAHRQADPVYRLGYERGRRTGWAETERKYEKITSLYAQYAIIVPPRSYQPSPLVARLKTMLGERLMNGPRLPLATRQLLFAETPATISPAA